MKIEQASRYTGIALAAAVAMSAMSPSVADADRSTGRTAPDRLPTGSVIFFHPDGTGAAHWSAARMYFHGPDGDLHWDRLPHMALYRGHMLNTLVGTSNGGATTHAFGYRVDAFGSFGKNGKEEAAVAIQSLSGYPGSLMREAANLGIPVGVVNDGHIGEPGTGAFLAEVGNRNDWQEIVRQMIQGRPGFTDTPPWVIMGGGEADTRPAGTTLLHRNHNEERKQPLDAQQSLRGDGLDLEKDWNDNGSGDPSNDPARLDDWIVLKTRADFEALLAALGANPQYAPHVLGLFAYQDTFNDRNEEDLIARGKVTSDPVDHVGPVTDSNPPTPGFRPKASRIILWGDVAGQPGHNPPTFAEMTRVAIEILDRAARRQNAQGNGRFFLVAEQEASDNFGNNGNAIGVLQAIADTDQAIGLARQYLDENPNTLILTAADSDAGGLALSAPYRNAVVTEAGTVNRRERIFRFDSNPAAGSEDLANIPDGLEGRGQNAETPPGTRMFLSEPDAQGQRMEFAIAWIGTGDYAGGILSRADGLNAELLHERFSARLDNIDVYRLMHLTLFGRLLDDPAMTGAVAR